MIPRSSLASIDAEYLDLLAAGSRDRRARNTAAGDCINENSKGTHGKATNGVRCSRCALVHRLGHSKAVQTFEYHHAQVTR
jgi:hypothetical protein